MSGVGGNREPVLITARANIDDRFSTNTILKDNVTYAEQHMMASDDPLMVAVALPKELFTCSMIEKSGVFALNLFHDHNIETYKSCRMPIGEHSDKFAVAKLAKREAQTIDCPILANASEHYECEVASVIEIGSNKIIIGNVLKRY